MPTQMPRNGRPRRPHGVLERFDHPGNGVEPTTAIGEGADAGQNDMPGASDSLGIGCDQHLDRQPASRAARSKAFWAECRLPEP